MASPFPVRAAEGGSKELGDAQPGEAFSGQALRCPWRPKPVRGHPEPRAPSQACSPSFKCTAHGHLHGACAPAHSHVGVHARMYTLACAGLGMQRPWELKDLASSYF